MRPGGAQGEGEMSRPLPRGCAGGVRGLEASIDTRCSLSVTRSTLTLSSTAVRKGIWQ